MSNELKYFNALKRITKYQTIEQLRLWCHKDYGLNFEQALEYAYENVINEARQAIKGKRPPKSKTEVHP